MSKWLRAFSVSLLYLVVLATIYVVHVRYFRVDVVFYAAIEDALAATALLALLLFAHRAFGVFNAFEKVQLIAIWLLVGYALAISVPTVLDRGHINPLFVATIEATDEAIVNALLAAQTMTGRDGNKVYGLPHDRVLEIMRRYGR